jgi:uncharacterized protein
VNASATELTLAGPAGRLSARLLEPVAPRWRAVVAHPHPLYGGTMDNAVVRLAVERLAAAGAAALAFDFRGVRDSEGAHDGGRGERLDLLAAERELERRHPGLPHWLAGYSFGATTCVGRLEPDLAGAPPVDALLLLAPPLANHPLAAAGHATAPVALITGELDPLTPEMELRRFRDRLRDLRSHRSLPGAGHDLGTAGPPGAAALVAALDRAIADLAAASRSG